MAITRTVEVTLTPAEAAEAFCGFFSCEQAEFFARVWEVAKDWPGAGWCQQSCSIVQSAANNPDAMNALQTLAEHVLHRTPSGSSPLPESDSADHLGVVIGRKATTR